MMKYNKKASMQLSINAIVILVMAMAVLGIGLGLIRGVLAPAQNNLEDALGKVDLDEIATSAEVIANLPSTLRLKSSAENQLAISFYNTGYSCPDATFTIDCNDDPVIEALQQLEINVEQGTAETLIGVYSPVGGTGKKPCELAIMCSGEEVASKALFVSFNS